MSLFRLASGECQGVRRKKVESNGNLSKIQEIQPRRVKLDVPKLELKFSKLNYHWSGHRGCSRGIADNDPDRGGSLGACAAAPFPRASSPSDCR